MSHRAELRRSKHSDVNVDTLLDEAFGASGKRHTEDKSSNPKSVNGKRRRKNKVPLESCEQGEKNADTNIGIKDNENDFKPPLTVTGIKQCKLDTEEAKKSYTFGAKRLHKSDNDDNNSDNDKNEFDIDGSQDGEEEVLQVKDELIRDEAALVGLEDVHGTDGINESIKDKNENKLDGLYGDDASHGAVDQSAAVLIDNLPRENKNDSPDIDIIINSENTANNANINAIKSGVDDNKDDSNCEENLFGLKDLFDYYHKDKSSFEVKLPPNLVLVADLDHTLIGNGPNETVEECNKYIDQFNQLWLNEYAPNNCILIYATGRSFDLFQEGCKKWRILKPDILIGADGVEIFWFNKNLARLVQHKSTYHIDLEFNDHSTKDDFVWKDSSWYGELNSNWNQKFAESLYYEYIEKYSDTMAPIPKGLELVEEFRVSVLVNTEEQAKRAVDFFETRIAEYNNNIKNNKEANNVCMKYHCFHCIEKGDDTWWAAITPEKGGKGAALDWICHRLHIKDNIKDRLIICGDSGNDISMMLNQTYQIVIMGNSSVELKSFYDENKNKEQRKNKMLLTKQHRTLGVIEGLKHFSKINSAFLENVHEKM